MLDTIETSRLAVTIRDSLALTAALSGLHLVGMTIIVGTSIVIGVQLIWRAFIRESNSMVTVPASRILLIGLSLSVISGLLRLLPRASAALANTTFRIKMSTLAAAIIVHFVFVRGRARDSHSRLGGVLQFALFVAVAVLGAMFTLLE